MNTITKTYHHCNGRYWYTFVNGWGNEQVVECTQEEYEMGMELAKVDGLVCAIRAGLAAQFGPRQDCGKRLVLVNVNGVTAVDMEWDYRQTVNDASYRQGVL